MKLEIKFEIWAAVEVPDEMTKDEVLETLTECDELGDVYNNIGDYEILDGDMCYCNLVRDDRCVWIDGDMYAYNDEDGEYKLNC